MNTPPMCCIPRYSMYSLYLEFLGMSILYFWIPYIFSYLQTPIKTGLILVLTKFGHISKIHLN